MIDIDQYWHLLIVRCTSFQDRSMTSPSFAVVLKYGHLVHHFIRKVAQDLKCRLFGKDSLISFQ